MKLSTSIFIQHSTSILTISLVFSQALASHPKAELHLTFILFFHENWNCLRTSTAKVLCQQLAALIWIIKCKFCVNKKFNSTTACKNRIENYSTSDQQELCPRLKLLEHKVLSRFPITSWWQGKCFVEKVFVLPAGRVRSICWCLLAKSVPNWWSFESFPSFRVTSNAGALTLRSILPFKSINLTALLPSFQPQSVHKLQRNFSSSNPIKCSRNEPSYCTTLPVVGNWFITWCFCLENL